jgi:uncharacterized protein (TIGR02646 family)
MKYLSHSITWPHKLALRYLQPVNNASSAWSGFGGKVELRQSLNLTQKYLCSYCEIELRDSVVGSHIEHIVPKSSDSTLTFYYENLMLSCFSTGAEIEASNTDPKPISCGHYKLSNFNADLFIKPTLQNCEQLFFYELDGTVVHNPQIVDPHDIARVDYTIITLNLNCRRLKRLRENIIVEGLEIVNELLDDTVALSNFVDLELAEINDKLSSFITTRKQYFDIII